MNAYDECPSFQSCNAPLCPLDELMLRRVALPGEAKCKARRATREAIATRYPDLPTAGLTQREIARDKRKAQARARWDSMSNEQRDAWLASRSKTPPPTPV